MTGLKQEIERYRERVEALSAEIGRGRAAIDPDRFREQIVALVSEVDEAIAGLQAVRDSARPVARSFQQLFPRGRPREPIRTDHLGSSTYRERGWSALSAGEYARAIADLERAVELDPGSSVALALLAWAHLRTGDRAPAAGLLEQANAQAPDAPYVRLASGILAFEEGRTPQAEDVLGALASETTDSTVAAFAHLYLGRVYAGEARAREAQAHYRAALEAAPNLAEAYWELGRSHYLDGRAELALEAWRAGAENRYNPWGDRCREEVAAVLEGGAV